MILTMKGNHLEKHGNDLMGGKFVVIQKIGDGLVDLFHYLALFGLPEENQHSSEDKSA